MRLRDAVPWVVLVFLLAGLAFFVWLTRYPEDPRLDRLEDWPGLGHLVGRLRGAYLPPPATDDAAGSSGGGEAAGHRPDGPDDDPEVLHLSGPEKVWVRPGIPLRAAPESGSAILAETHRYTALPVFERHPARPVPGEERPAFWLRVELEGLGGWIRWTEPPPGEPPLGRDPEPVKAIAAQPPDPRRLALAREILGPGHRTGSLDAYVLLTDVDDPPLLARLASVAAGLEAVYRERYGLELVGLPAEAILLFDRQEDYRAFQRLEASLAGLPAAGHAGHGLAALYHGGRSAEEIAATLVHEIVHLLNRRGLGPLLPPWLDEGLAEDLAWSEIDAAGRLLPGTFGGRTEVDERTLHTTGGLASLLSLKDFIEALDQGVAPRPEDLVALDWESFVRTNRQTHYLESGFLIRFFLDGADGELAAGFRSFLAATGRGEAIDPRRPAAAPGRSWPEIEGRFRAWLDELAAANEEWVSSYTETSYTESGSSSRQAAAPPS